jgi:hypothetical protein
MLLDVSASCHLVLVAPLRQVQLHARLYQAQNPAARLLAPPVEGRSFAKLDTNQLIHLIYGLGSAPEGDYAALCAQALALVQARPLAPDTLESLEKEVARQHLPEPDLNHEAKPKVEKPKAEKKPDTSFSNPERPKAGTTTGMVWDIADELQKTLGRQPTSKEVVVACEKEGLKAGTVSVQYGKWKKYQVQHSS